MSPKHLVLSCKANWSHLRSLCIFATRITSSRAVIITVLVANNEGLVDRVTCEVARSLDEYPAVNGAEIRIVGLSTETKNNAILDDDFRLTWRALMSGKPIQSHHGSTQVAAAAKPSIAILDGFQLSWLDIIRADPSPPLVFQWMMAFSGGLLYMCGPPNLGGRTGQSVPSSVHSCANQVRIPGMPPMTCHELHPQALGDKVVKIQLAEASLVKFLNEADGLLTTCAAEYDGEECLDSISSWFGCRNARPTFHLGPMLPLVPGTQRFSSHAIETEIAASPGQCGKAAMAFLDRAKKCQGERSVFYISFGTEHWPSSMEHVEALLSALAQREHPFIFSHAHPTAEIPHQMRTKFEVSGQGIFLPFAPQQALLAHKACGWFVTHGGANGTMEAISQGVPMIGWPFAVDQPLNIAHLARTLDVAFELTTIRTGTCPFVDHQSVRIGVESASNSLALFEAEIASILDEARGKVGQRKRANAEQLGATLGLAWSKPGGRATQEFSRLLDYYGV